MPWHIARHGNLHSFAQCITVNKRLRHNAMPSDGLVGVCRFRLFTFLFFFFFFLLFVLVVVVDVVSFFFNMFSPPSSSALMRFDFIWWSAPVSMRVLVCVACLPVRFGFYYQNLVSQLFNTCYVAFSRIMPLRIMCVVMSPPHFMSFECHKNGSLTNF